MLYNLKPQNSNKLAWKDLKGKPQLKDINFANQHCFSYGMLPSERGVTAKRKNNSIFLKRNSKKPYNTSLYTPRAYFRTKSSGLRYYLPKVRAKSLGRSKLFYSTFNKQSNGLKGINNPSKAYYLNFSTLSNLVHQVENRFATYNYKSIYGVNSTNQVESSQTNNEAQSTLSLSMATFWKDSYPLSLYVVGSDGQPVSSKKTSRIPHPVRRIFLKVGLGSQSWPLLQKPLLKDQVTSEQVPFESEVGLVKRKVVTPLSQLSLSSVSTNLTLIPTFLDKSLGLMSHTTLRQSYLTSNTSVGLGLLWNVLFLTNNFMHNFTFKSFFYKNNDLIQSFIKKFLLQNALFYQNQFFTLNRSKLLRTGVSQNTSLSNEVRTPAKKRLFQLVDQKGNGYRHFISVFKRYYNFIEFSRVLSQWKGRRPIYSHLFSQKSIYQRFLITITAVARVIPYWRMVWNKSLKSSISGRGLLNSVIYNGHDNFIETNYDVVLLQSLNTKAQLGYNNRLQNTLSRIYNVLSEPINSDIIMQNLTNRNYIALEQVNLINTLNNQSNTHFLNLKSRELLFTESDSEGGLLVLSNPSLFKFLFWDVPTAKLNHLFYYKLLQSRSQLNLNLTKLPLLKSNILPLSLFKYTIRRKIIKLVVSSKYLPRTTTYFYRTLVHFMEFYTGKKVYIKLNPFIENSLTYSDLARCYMWFGRVNPYQRILGHRIFVHESLRIFHLAIRFRDPTFLSNWIKAMLYRMSFWKYRVLFRYIKYILRMLFSAHFEELNFKGIKLTLRGKISVAGNARTRTLAFSIGKTSHSEMNNRVLSSFTNIHSFTGVMGFRLSFYF